MTTHRGTILLVDDEEKILKALGRALRDAGHAVVDTTSPRHAQKLLAERSFDLLVVDNVMPALSGLDLIREYVASTPENERSQILMMTAHATVESAIEAMKLGALDYLQKPFEIDELLVVARRALEHQRLTSEYRYLRTERDEQFGNYGIVGRSRPMQEIIERAELVAQTKSTVLITGETGTGKELVARAIHNRSAQREMPLIKVNCAAIPETLLESELFGHVRGAFTGAATSKKGKFALADGGSIFLDEIGTMSPTLQAKLLRVLQEREFEPLGSERTEKIDVRVIAATNRDLRQMVAESRFQEDLFYRLNVIPIHLPPLREVATTSLPWSNTSCASMLNARAGASTASTTGSFKRCSSTNGPATCVNSRTRSSAPWCCRPEQRSRRRRFRSSAPQRLTSADSRRCDCVRTSSGWRRKRSAGRWKHRRV